jgi:hypothetical protein
MEPTISPINTKIRSSPAYSRKKWQCSCLTFGCGDLSLSRRVVPTMHRHPAVKLTFGPFHGQPPKHIRRIGRRPYAVGPPPIDFLGRTTGAYQILTCAADWTAGTQNNVEESQHPACDLSPVSFRFSLLLCLPKT